MVANVNRWRQQLGLDALPENELNKLVTPLDLSDGKATLVDLIGVGEKTRLVGAIVPREGKTWFYKLMGDAQVVGREKEAFTKFVQTAKY